MRTYRGQLMRQQIGSQLRERLNASGYRLLARLPSEVLLVTNEYPNDFSKPEIWFANDHHSGYTIQIGRWGYEFARDASPNDLKRFDASINASVSVHR